MARSKARSSDESDEDYLVGQDEEFEDSDDECNLTVDEEDLDEIVCGSEKEFVEKRKKVGRSKAKGGLHSWGRGTRKNRTVKPKRKRKALYKFVEEEDEEEEDCDDEDYDFDDRKKEVARPGKKKRTAHRDEEEEDGDGEDYDFDDETTKEVIRPRKKKRTAHRNVEDEEEVEEDNDDGDYNFDDEKTKEVIRPRKKKRTAHRVSEEEEEEEEEDDDDDDDDDEDYEFGDEKTKEVRRPRETKRTAHRRVREEVEEDDDDASDDENVKEVIIPRKKKGIARREVHGYIGNTDASSGVVKENEFVHKREKKRVSYREEGSDNVSDHSFVKPRRRKRGLNTEDNEDVSITSEEDFDVNKLKIVRKPRRKRTVRYREVDDEFGISQEEDFDNEKGPVDEKSTAEELVSYREEDVFGIKNDIPEVKRNKNASKSRNKKDVSYRDDDDDDYVGMDETDEDEEFKPNEINELDDGEELPLMKEMNLSEPMTENEISYREDDDFDGMDENDEDEEFRPDEINELDDEAECSLIEKEKVGKPVLQGKEVDYREDDGDYDGIDDNEEVEEFTPDEINDVDDKEEQPLQEKETSCREDDDDYDGINDDDEDEEFTPDEIDDLDDEEELRLMKQKKKVGRPTLQETRIRQRQKRKRKLMISKKAARRKPKGNYRLRRCTNDERVIKKNSVVEERSKKVHRRGKKRRLTMNSDSDLVSSGSSDYEFTISEEEREQIREANELCRNLITSSRSSILSEMSEEHKEVLPQRKRLTRKGKEKVEDVEVEVGKQVCGICLTEEGKSMIRGTLNCCSHYFCFACIMEWSKVESRCPLCKQRFATISKPAKCNTGFDLRTVVIQIPERDQVYQPSEEELQGFLDPYDNVICTECHQGGDDALMLLCDLCDSPAHTYCVGLGREVPEGNWYCDGCRPTALGSPNQQVLTPTVDHTTTTYGSIGSSPAPNIRETFDLNEMYVPDTPSTQDSCQVPSPRPPVGDGQLPSPGSGSGALTVLGRRRIQRQIHNILNNRWRHMDNRTREPPSSVSGRSLFGFQVGQNREFAVQHVATQQRVPENNLGLSWGLSDSTMPLMQHRDVLGVRFPHMREQSREHYPSTSTNPSFGTFIPNEFSGLNSRAGLEVGHQQLQPCSVGPSAGSDPGMSSHPYREVSPFPVEKPQIQSMVRSQLIRLSRDLQLAHSTFKDIARSSTHTILAICGAEHRQRDVHPVQTSLICHHTEGAGNVQTSRAKGPCFPCFDHFVKSVVSEIMRVRVPVSSKNNDFDNL
ncbi:hypothetical protein LIER_27308 [Lithospermum erythrorhizon]|uniref:Uncharacterized protein n=1 Tax=Lithospermum erythrorhizon TaxID=34254 RepID=A0AAV3RD43_LITER